MENKCFECETAEDLQQHHVVPKSRGGTKTVTLCHSCHMKAHGRDSKGLDHSRLTKEGLARAKARGVKLGNPRWKESLPKGRSKLRAKGKATADKYMPIIEGIRNNGITSYRGIAKEMNRLGIKSPKGKNVSAALVRSVILRIEEVING